jgi:TRAP-type uncharacterized transport system substrate-binding protein
MEITGVAKLSMLFQRELPDVAFVVKENLGSAANIDSIQRGGIDIAIGNSDIVHKAFTTGTEINHTHTVTSEVWPYYSTARCT